MISLDELAKVAALPLDKDEVVSRRWLRQVLVELRQGRAAQAAIDTALKPVVRAITLETRRQVGLQVATLERHRSRSA